MLQRIWIDNFKTLVNLSFEPKGINLLIGLNNTGKTNLCEALRFLSLTSRATLDQAAAEFGGPAFLKNHQVDSPDIRFRVEAVLPFGEDHESLTFTYDLTCTLTRAVDLALPISMTVRREILSVSGRAWKDRRLLERGKREARLLDEERYLEKVEGGQPRLSDSKLEALIQVPLESTALSQLYSQPTNRRANAFKSYLQGWQYYALSTTAMRLSQARAIHPLNVDGGNLAGVLYELKTSREKEYRRLLQFAKEIEPEIEYLNFTTVGNQIFMILEDAQGHKRPASISSSGTLRYLALTYVLLMACSSPCGFIAIDEPENGIHVHLLRKLMELAEKSGSSQILFVSHSPYFIDLFDKHLDSVFVCRKEAYLSAISNVDRKKIEQMLQEYPLGELHFKEMLA